MRSLPAGLQTHLDSGVTTLCQCWRLTLQSGETIGFTDHDVSITFAGTEFEARSGFTGSEIEAGLGFSVDNLEASGALESGRLDETRLSSGDFDHAEVEIWKVNWQNVLQRTLVRSGHLGEVTAGAGRFTAEVRGLTHVLGQTRGRLYQFGCDATLGDGRCGVNLNTASFLDTGTLTSSEGATVTFTGVGFASAWLDRGVAKWLTGAGAGRSLAIKRHRRSGSNCIVTLWDIPAFEIAVGDQVQLTTGCDKQFATCRTKFANSTNFRGFPHMPGTDFVAAFPRNGDPDNNGAKRN